VKKREGNGRLSRPTTKKSNVRIRLSRLKPNQRETYRRALDTVKLLREHRRYSLARAAQESGTSAPTVRRYAGSALAKRRGRYGAKPTDRLPRGLIFYDSEDELTLRTRSSRQASEIARYHNAVKAYVIHGDDTALREFEGKSIRVNGVDHPYVTDRRVLRKLERAGVLRFLDIYQEKFDDDGT
jgi:hypothetical protein